MFIAAARHHHAPPAGVDAADIPACIDAVGVEVEAEDGADANDDPAFATRSTIPCATTSSAQAPT